MEHEPPQGMAILGADDAAHALKWIVKEQKIRSWLNFHRFGLPTLQGVIVTSWGQEAHNTIRAFATHIGADWLLIRSDREGEVGASLPGGYLVDVNRAGDEASSFLAHNRTVYFLEPRSRFDDLYSLSIGWFAQKSLVIEVVGPGFDASDLKRGQESPHEVFAFAIKAGEDLVLEQHTSVDVEEYRDTWFRRLRRIASLLHEGSALPASELERRVGAQLRHRGETLLLENRTSYAPIPESLVQSAAHFVLRFIEEATAAGEDGQRCVLSMSYFGKAGEPIYWDAMWWPASIKKS